MPSAHEDWWRGPDYSKLPAPVRALMEQLDGMPPLDYVRDHVSTYSNDAWSIEEAYGVMRLMPTSGLRRDLDMLESLLSQELPPGTLTSLVARDFNEVMDGATDEGSRQFLHTVGDMLRQAIDEKSGS